MYITTPDGVYAATFDSATGEMGGLRAVLPGAKTSFLAVHPTLPLLYVPEPETVTSYRIGDDGALTGFNRVPMAGGGPVHIGIDPAARMAVVPSYGGATAAVFPLGEDGALQPHSALFRYQGSSVDPERQTRSYPHGVAFHPTRDLAVIADLGSDKLWLYDVDGAAANLTPHDPDAVVMTPGAGPRHAVFHDNGRWLYVINELDNTITVLAANPDELLDPQQRISTLPDDFIGFSKTSEIVLHPSGRFLYGSNRGHESIAVYRVDADSGRLSVVEFASIRGREPRFVGLDPSGQYLLSANQYSDAIVSFAVDPATGGLTPTGHQLDIAGAHCIVFR